MVKECPGSYRAGDEITRTVINRFYEKTYYRIKTLLGNQAIAAALQECDSVPSNDKR